MDEQIRHWAAHGLGSSLLESHRDFKAFKRAWSKVNLKDLPLPDLMNWWERLNLFVVRGLEEYLNLERHLASLEDTVYTLASDSLRRLKADKGETMFFTRTARKQAKGKFRRVLERGKETLLRFLYRTPSRKHGVWFGVTVDFEKLYKLLDQLRGVIEGEPRLRIKVNFEDALLREVEAELQILGTDILRAPPGVERNIGMIGVRRRYAELTEDARDAEFQTSMCLDHCRSMWQMVLSSMLPTMLRPQMMQRYEKSFGGPWALNHLSDPALVNSWRMVLRSDAALEFFDHSTPRDIRNELKGLESGQGTMFSYYMLFTSRAHQRLGNQYLALHLQQQAPFMGNMVMDWILTRRKHAVAAIVSTFVLTFLGIYTVLSFLDILQNLVVSGATPPFDCVWNPFFQEMACSPVPAAASMNTAWVTALQQVFAVGLYAGLTQGAVHFMAVGSIISIVVNKSKTLMRLQMSINAMLMRLYRRGARSFSRIREYFANRRAVQQTMLKRVTLGLKRRFSAADVSSAKALQAAESLMERSIYSRSLGQPGSQKSLSTH